MGLKVGKLNNNNSDVPRYLFFAHLGSSPRGLIWGIAKKKERSPENIIITPVGFGNLIHIPSSSFSLLCLPSSDELPNLWWNTKLPKQPLISSPLIIIISTLSYLMRAFLSPLSPSCLFSCGNSYLPFFCCWPYLIKQRVYLNADIYRNAV